MKAEYLFDQTPSSNFLYLVAIALYAKIGDQVEPTQQILLLILGSLRLPLGTVPVAAGTSRPLGMIDIFLELLQSALGTD